MRTDGKRPEGLSLIPPDVVFAHWQILNVKLTANEAGAAAEFAAARKVDKYNILTACYTLQPVADESLYVFHKHFYCRLSVQSGTYNLRNYRHGE